MAFLKKYIFITLFLVITKNTCTAQSNSNLLKAFNSSYYWQLKANYPKAIQALETIKNQFPYEYNLRCGWLYYLMGNYTTSVQFYQLAIKEKPTALEPIFGIINPLIALQHIEDVIKQYQQILAINPQEAIAIYQLALLYFNREEYTKCIELLNTYCKLYPTEVNGLLLSAKTFLKLKDYSKANSFINQLQILYPLNMELKKLQEEYNLKK
jgi:tetratricopeptide (TPR) repeat protein